MQDESMLQTLRRLLHRDTVPDEIRDAHVIELLRRSGTDLSQPLPVELFLSFPDERAARRVAVSLIGMGGQLRVGRSAMGGRGAWAVALKLQVILTFDRIRELRAQLGQIAAEYGGEVEGWGAPAR